MTVVRGSRLGFVAMLVVLPSAGYAQRQRVQAAELVGTWAGRVVETSRPAVTNVPAAVAGQHLIVRSDSTYVWVSAGERPTPEAFQRWRALRGDTLVLDTARVYTIARKGQELWLTAIGAARSGTVFRFERDWTTQPVTNGPIKCKNGRIKTFACANVELLSYLPIDAIGGAAGTDVWGWHDSTTGREFLITGGYFGGTTAFVEVTDPLHPHYLGVLLPHDSTTVHANGRQSVKVYQHYALITYERSGAKPGLQIFDLTQLRNVKTSSTFRETAYYNGIAYALSLTVNPETGFLYVNGSNTCGGGPHMLDIRAPMKPVFAGCYTEPKADSGTGYVNDAQCVVYRGPDQQYQGREICVTYAIKSVGIVDVTDKQRPKTISLATYPKVASTNQGWFTEDQRYVFLNDELDESVMASQFGIDSMRTRTIGLDLNDLDHPVLLTEFYNGNSRATDHNLYIRGRYMYQGNYGAGLRIIDVANPKALKEVGYFSPRRNDASDKAYKSDQGGWGGPRAWGTYPYFKNGTVAVSLTTGIALVRLRKP